MQLQHCVDDSVTASAASAVSCVLCAGLIAQPNQASSDVLNRISLYQWVVERLQGAKDPE